jgi:hypothetical protein
MGEVPQRPGALPQPTYISPSMIRIAISLAAYQAIASTMPEGIARPPEPLEVGEGVGMWIDHATLAALKWKRRAGERLERGDPEGGCWCLTDNPSRCMVCACGCACA